jgi:hypothetical protein
MAAFLGVVAVVLVAAVLGTWAGLAAADWLAGEILGDVWGA